MANWNDPQPRRGFGASPSLDGQSAGRTTYDAGLRRHMLSIYNYMASGVLLSGVVAVLFANYGLTQAVMATPLKWVIMLAPLGFVFAISGGAQRFSESTLKVLYWAFAAVMGMSLSTIFLIYTNSSIATTFFATAAAFSALSLYGYTTKKDLSGFGTFLIMGVVGILIASLLNMFLGSSTLQLAISVLGVLIFAGLTAYDTQMLKNQYAQLRGTDFVGKAVILGALSLYLDFINMFQFLLSFLGQRD
ncbi:membrane protein [Novosphingobium barchaimii LL02]|uniref:Membrane protein n=1 Tax=Novosphingobium barchaimii LL02 TaxID=1114963 RepID=A0A0J7XTE8_9SPHN|nr:Bax inhibitor-1/YccA family protein [Novosphingobium barchaimii]KMS54932.1 membrane protein [Novosphingobium barchaimii LL02]